MKVHRYETNLTWTGNLGDGTAGYRSYSRSFEIRGPGKPVLYGSSDPHFLGDSSRYNPEELLLQALSSCHMLWYLHLCSENQIIVVAYEDSATGTMQLESDGRGQFTEAVLNPRVSVTSDSNLEMAKNLHSRASQLCFIARSVNFPVRHFPTISAVVE